MNDAASIDRLRARYLDLMELSLGNAIYGESRLETRVNAFLQRLRHPYLTRRGTFDWSARAHSMIGPKRLRNVRELVEATIKENIPGDYIETGVWRGGACILMRAVLAAYDVRDRRILCADSFEGLPPPDSAQYPSDKKDRLHVFDELAVSVEQVKRNFASYNLLDDQVVFVKGYFRDTLATVPSDRFALIRLDGDMYESTMIALNALYDKLSDKGFVIIDDYGALRNCKQAVHDFLDQRKLSPKIVDIDGVGVWWRKTG
jgi:O-methyltransferase